MSLPELAQLEWFVSIVTNILTAVLLWMWTRRRLFLAYQTFSAIASIAFVFFYYSPAVSQTTYKDLSYFADLISSAFEMTIAIVAISVESGICLMLTLCIIAHQLSKLQWHWFGSIYATLATRPDPLMQARWVLNLLVMTCMCVVAYSERMEKTKPKPKPKPQPAYDPEPPPDKPPINSGIAK